MVVWSELAEVIARNPEKGFCVPTIHIRSESVIERFPILRIPANVVHVEESDAESIEPPPPSPPSPPSLASLASLSSPPSLPSLLSTPPMQQPANQTVLRQVLQPAAPKEPHTLKREVDPIVLGIDQNDPLYDGAPQRTKHQMECEEAQRLEGVLNELYKSQGGRSRGWTKTGLESMLKPRCASGGDIKELDRAKKAFLWQLVIEDKPCSAFLDFVCVAKKIRVAVWFQESKQVILYPAADNLDDGDEFPLYNVTSQGLPRIGIRTCEELVAYCDSNKFILMPPNSVVHSLSTLNMGELESVGKKLGMASVEGSKAERVAKLAIFKLRQRLQSG